ncbi:MAG: LysR family transcriptional regulator, partial [Acetobacteraceae bacterium]
MRRTVTSGLEVVKYTDPANAISQEYGTLELRHLRYFVAIAEEGHVTRAAARLGLQQPPLSQQLRALEAELGVALFTRLPRGMELTPAGRAFLQESRTVLAAAERAAAQAVMAARGQSGEIVLGLTTSAVLHPLLPAIMGDYHRAYPDVLLRPREGNAAELTDALAAGSLHVAFLRAVVGRPIGVTFIRLLEEELLVALPPGHRLAERDDAAVALRELAGEGFILVRRQSAPGMYADVVEACRAAGFEPRIVTEVGRMLTNISLVAAGVGISLVPASMRGIALGGVCYKRIADAGAPSAPLTLGMRADDSCPTVANLLAISRARALMLEMA